MSHESARAVLLDRDGTVIVERNYLSDPAGVELLPGAASGLRRMADLGYRLVVVSNQSGVGRGYFDERTLAAIHERLNELLAAEGVRLDGIYYCPHTPEADCSCRKPRPGLIERAAAELDFEPTRSVVIGDKTCDIELGRAVSARTILVKTGYGRQHEAAAPEYVVDDLFAAADVVASFGGC